MKLTDCIVYTEINNRADCDRKGDTVLGPLLFSMYINDIMVGIESEIRLFADDCICYCQIDSTGDTSKLQKDIDQLGKGPGNGV